MTVKTRQFPINAFLGIVFFIFGTLSAVRANWLDTTLWASISIAFLCIGANEQSWDNKPIWRRTGAIIFLLVGLAAMVVRIVSEFNT
jgi:hypothetical protein